MAKKKKKLDPIVISMFRLLRKIEKLQRKYDEMKKSIIDDLRDLPNQEYITEDPKLKIRIEAKLVTRETWKIPVDRFIERFKERVNINDFLQVDGNKVKYASEHYGIFRVDELKEIGLERKTIEYVTIREVKRK